MPEINIDHIFEISFPSLLPDLVEFMQQELKETYGDIFPPEGSYQLDITKTDVATTKIRLRTKGEE